MIGLNKIDLYMDENGQPVADRMDAVVVSDLDCWFQDVRNEAITQEGELFYDATYGWSLLDFAQIEHDEFYEMEIDQRIKEKLSKRDMIDERSISTEIEFKEKVYMIHIQFKFNNSDMEYNIDLNIDGAEVTIID